jgi:hypothetical protein
MKNLFYSILLIAGFAIISSCGGSVKEKKSMVEAIEISVDSLLKDASALEGKTVKFEAKVDHACAHKGKRLTVYGTVEGKTLKIDGTESSPSFANLKAGQMVEITGNVRKVPGSHVEDCEVEEGNEVPEIAYTVECINYKEL